MAWAITFSTRARSFGFIAFQSVSSNALRAAFTARSTSSTVAFATVATTSPVAGLYTLNVSPLLAGCHWPSMKSGKLMHLHVNRHEGISFLFFSCSYRTTHRFPPCRRTAGSSVRVGDLPVQRTEGRSSAQSLPLTRHVRFLQAQTARQTVSPALFSTLPSSLPVGRR